MTPEGLAHPGSERVIALSVLLVVTIVAGWTLTSPLMAGLAARADALDRVERYRAILQNPLPQAFAYDPALLATAHSDASSAQLDLQSLLDDRARSAMLAMRSLTPASSESMSGVGEITWMEAVLHGDLQAVVEFLTLLDAERPVLLVRIAELRVGNPADPDRSLELRIEVGRVWRTPGAGQ